MVFIIGQTEKIKALLLARGLAAACKSRSNGKARAYIVLSLMSHGAATESAT